MNIPNHPTFINPTVPRLRAKVNTLYSDKGCLHRFAARGLRLKLQQKQALLASLDPISVFALDVLQINFLLWSLVGNSSKSINKTT